MALITVTDDSASPDSQLDGLLRRLLPKGPNPAPLPDWSKCPAWPPDLFAVTASSLERSGAYAMPQFTFAWSEGRYGFSDREAKIIARLGRQWRSTGEAPPAVEKRWSLWREPAAGTAGERAARRAKGAMWLLAVADEAASGMGFSKETDGVFAPQLFIEQLRRGRGETGTSLPGLPNSVCRMVPPSEACVQPKTNVPAVGITLRSLSHHLALLPPTSVVATEWLFAHPAQDRDGPLNLLLVPFPYRVSGRSFRADPNCIDGRNGYFTLDHEWLRQDGELISPEAFYAFLKALVLKAKRECEQVHGLVFPEGALPRAFANKVAQLLARQRINDGFPELELFISGVTGERRGDTPGSWTYAARLHEDSVLKPWWQKKHHRWRLDAGQVRRYQLGHVLDPTRVWWEKIDVAHRTCKFTVIRPGATLTVLVCEDLARSEPVMPAVNAVGPNLLIALLMDGPQLESRWSARYATVLADDPGCSVLTLTCRGMIRRSSAPGFRGPDAIALWKQQDGQATQLLLPDQDHGLMICLTSRPEEQFTMDMRSDGGGTVRFGLSSTQPVRLDSLADFPWLQMA